MRRFARPLTVLVLGALSGLSVDARAGNGAQIASIAIANVGKGACSTDSTGGIGFASSCTGNGGQPEYWCADFARWVWGAAGVDTAGLDAAAGSFYVYGQNNNTLHYPPSVGDAVVFDYSGDGVANHVAIVVQVNADNTIETVSGDWGGNGASEAAFSSSSSAVFNTPAYASTVGTVPGIMGMTISGFVSSVGGAPPCTDACALAARVGMARAPTGEGYWIADAAGHVYPEGNASFFGDLTGVSLTQPVVGIAATPSGQGYWMVAADGGVFAFGNAGFHGSRGGSPLNKPVVGMASTPTGLGYWLVAADGGIFTYGDAAFEGSAGGMTLNKPVVGMAATTTGHGYWLVAADGGIFNYGDAPFEGSAGGMTLNAPVVGMAASATGKGYWLVAADGGIFTYGDATFHGSAGGMTLAKPVVGMATTADIGGYWLVAADGGIFTYGDAPYLGNGLGSTCSGNTPVQCVVAASGCTVTSNATACAAGDACDHGTCQATCTDTCTAGSSRCSGTGLEVCGHYGSEPCNTWSAAAACPTGQSCTGDVCSSPTCTDACEPGATECMGGELATCGATTDAGCRTWGSPTACQFGQTCQAGGCASVGHGAHAGDDGGVGDGGSTDAAPVKDAAGKGVDGSTKGQPSSGDGSSGSASETPSSGGGCTTGAQRATPWQSLLFAALLGFNLVRRRRRAPVLAVPAAGLAERSGRD